MSASPPVTSPSRQVAIGGWDIGRCLTRLHHDRFTQAVAVPDPVRDRTLARGIAFEDHVVEHLLRVTPGAVVVAWQGGSAEAERATLAAMANDAPLIIGGRLAGHDDNGAIPDLVGAPDILVRLVDGYAAIEVKHHKVIGDRGIEGVLTPLDHIGDLDVVRDPDTPPTRFRSHRRRDLLQVTHYQVLLERHGFGSAASVGGVIGTDEPLGCLWVGLDEGEPSLRDDHAAYVERARWAIAEGSRSSDTPAVLPWLRGECRSCDWERHCRSELTAADDPTLLRDVDDTLRADLFGSGITTVAAVAALPLDDPRFEGGEIVRQARAMTAGRLLRADAGDGALDLPSSPLEVDFDIETHDAAVYLAGLLLTEDGASTYRPIVDWSDTIAGERSLILELFATLGSLAEAGATLFHWTEYEIRILTEAAERHGLEIPKAAGVSDWFAAHAVDLCAWSRTHLVSPEGHSLKVIAPLCGFRWRDADPGGLQSEIWFEELLAGDTAMRARLLAYNEDDVIAQREIRRWVRAQDDGEGPGTTIPSVATWPISEGSDTAA